MAKVSGFKKKYGNKPVGTVVNWKGRKMKRMKKTGSFQWRFVK